MAWGVLVFEGMSTPPDKTTGIRYGVIHKHALRQLRDYALDNPIDAERLGPFLAAVDSGNWDLAWQHGRDALSPYCACSVLIDDLYLQCQSHAR